MEILLKLPEDLRIQVDLELDQLEELAFDPRAIDFHHPIQHRPSHIYGTWDPHRLDLKGRYTRYVAQQIVLDLLAQWVKEEVEQGGFHPKRPYSRREGPFLEPC